MTIRVQVDEFCIRNDGFCIENDEHDTNMFNRIVSLRKGDSPSLDLSGAKELQLALEQVGGKNDDIDLCIENDEIRVFNDGF